MLLANVNGSRLNAIPGARGKCPACNADVIAKCGQIISWHWAHIASDCDPWSEPMTKWHSDWQNRFPSAWREVVLGAHRADIKVPDGPVIEFQHSSISVEEIREREDFYRQMIWVYDARDAFDSGRITVKKGVAHGIAHRRVTFRWKQPRTTIMTCKKPVFLDMGPFLMNMTGIRQYPHSTGSRTGGGGHLLEICEFVKEQVDKAPKHDNGFLFDVIVPGPASSVGLM